MTRCRQPTTRDLIARNHIGNGSTAIVRRECFAMAGLFDESLASCEDAEMWTRLSVRTPYALRLVPSRSPATASAPPARCTPSRPTSPAAAPTSTLPQLRARLHRPRCGADVRAAPARPEPQGVLERRRRARRAPFSSRRCAIRRASSSATCAPWRWRDCTRWPSSSRRGCGRCRIAPVGRLRGAYGRLVGAPRGATRPA